jgi:hypothetical protein
VAFAFDKSDDFAFDKAAEEPCLHLDLDFRCMIHDRLGDAGFGGCVAYECFGAGQRVTEELFGGRNWRNEPAIARQMFAAFGMLRKVHELLVLLKTTEKLDLTPEQKSRRAQLWRHLNPDDGWTQSRLMNFEQSGLGAEVSAFLKSLRTRGDVLRTAGSGRQLENGSKSHDA